MDKRQKRGFVIFKDWLSLIEDLNMEQRGRLFTAILELENFGTDPDFSDDVELKVLFKVVHRALADSDREYEETVKRKEYEGKLGGIIRSLREGRSIKAENIIFLESEGMLTAEYLSGRGIRKETIENLLARVKEMKQAELQEQVESQESGQDTPTPAQRQAYVSYSDEYNNDLPFS